MTITGRVHAEADWWPDGSQNATQNFWRAAEGLSVNPAGGLAGVLLDAGTTNSPVLMDVGPAGSSANHAANPTVLSDVFFRIGGAIAGKAIR